MSPNIHNALFENLNIDAKYEAIQIAKGQLREEIPSLLGRGCRGFNVTIPHKVDIISLLDELDPLAERIGAVNTVLVNNHKLIGYNTDGPGFLESLKQFDKLNINDAKVLIIGSGGAARAIVMTLAMNGGAKLTIANRTLSKAQELLMHSKTSGRAITLDEAESCLAQYDVIINTTSIGMSPQRDKTPLKLQNVKKDAYVCDIIYNPLQTLLLEEAKAKGCYVQNGVPMFIRQAALAFKLWTGRNPDLNQMNNIVYQNMLKK